MKKLLFVLFVMSGVAFGLISCKESGNNVLDDQTTTTELSGTKDDTPPCCRVMCRMGSCETYQSPCHCTCVAGLPVCGGLGNGGDPAQKGEVPKIVVKATQAMMPLYDEDADYIEQTLHHAGAAQALRNIKQLFIDNQYVLSTPATIQAYLENAAVYESFIQTQPQEVIDRLSSLE
ncbi:MAG: hypothetical protein K6A41_00380 [Bacteroidales bacterium]|nr:hypothetical protein [Bacteroidales bacterium]